MSREQPLSPERLATPLRTPGVEVFRRFLLGAIVALLVARPLVPGEDPGLLFRPWTSAAGMVLTQLWLLTAVGGAVWRLLTGRAVSWGWIDFGLLGLVGLVFASTLTAAGYKHPAWLITSEWVAIFFAFRVVRQLAGNANDQQRLLAVLVASAVSVAAHGLFQTFSKETPFTEKHPLPKPGLVRDDLDIGPPALPADLVAEPGAIRGPFVQPPTLAAYLLLLLPAACCFALTTWRERRWSVQTILTAACALAIAAPLIAITVRKQWRLPSAEVLNSTWQVVAAHPWLGVGPGNFSRHYSRFVAVPCEWISSPPSGLLDVAAGAGIPALVVLVGIVVLLCKQVKTFVKLPMPAEPQPLERRQGLEYYLGGMAGLTLGFVLAASSQTPEWLRENILRWGMIACARALIWFAVFGVLENISLSARARSLAAGAGVIACLLFLSVSGGLAFPSLAQPLWVLIALAVNASQPGHEVMVAHWLRAFAPLPITLLLSLTYLLYFVVPVLNCEQTMRSVRRQIPGYWERFQKIEEAKTPQAKKNAVQIAERHLREKILVPLQDPVRQDPGDLYPLAERTRWLIEQVKLAPARAADERLDKLIQTAREIDPDGTEVLALECQLEVLFSQRANKQQHLDAALKVLEEMRRRDPQSPRIRYGLAEVHSLRGELKDGRYHAEQALQLDHRCPDPRRRLTPGQKLQLRDRFGLTSGS